MVNLIEVNAKYVHNNLALRYFRERISKADMPYWHGTFTINQPYTLVLSSLSASIHKVFMFSCYIWNVEMVLKLAYDLKQLRPDVVIVLGGPEVSFHDETWLNKHWFVDAIIPHEGEWVIEQLIEAYLDGMDTWETYLHEMPRIFPIGEPIHMDALGLGYTVEELKRFSIVYYESSRGCPYKCSYCMSALGSSLRFKSMDCVEQEIAFLMKFPLKVVKFIDRTFNAPIHRAIDILKLVEKYDNGITTCHFELSPNGLSEELIGAVKGLRKDLVQFELGIQSTYEPTLEAVNRHMPLNTLESVKTLCSLENCHTHLDLIAGLPLETLDMFMKSVKSVLSLKPDHLQLGMLKLLHGSELRKDAVKYGYRFSPNPPYEFLFHHEMSYSDKVYLMSVEEGIERVYNAEKTPAALSYIHDLHQNPTELYYSIGKWINEELLAGYQVSMETVFEKFLNILHECEDLLPYYETIEGLMAWDLWRHDHKLPGSLKKHLVASDASWHTILRHRNEWICDDYRQLPVKQLIKKLSILALNFNPMLKLKPLTPSSELCYLVKLKGSTAVGVLTENDIQGALDETTNGFN